MITPQQWVSTARVSYRTEIEERLDQAIASSPRMPLYVNVQRPWATDDIEYVMARYRALGWQMEILYDQRDGNCIKVDVP